MRVLLCFSTSGQIRENNRVVVMPRCPRVGETLETGERTWFVERVVSTPDDPEQDIILHLQARFSTSQPSSEVKPGAHVVLHVEDDDGDEFFVRRAVNKSSAPLHMMRVVDGREGIAYLQGEGDFRDRSKFPLPEAVLLDLKMPRMSGYEVLEWIRAKPEFKALPIIVLTSSTLYKDKERVTALGATAFLTKTVLMDDVPARLLEVLKPSAPNNG
jgi:CheY-like chemotaxis protein